MRKVYLLGLAMLSLCATARESREVTVRKAPKATRHPLRVQPSRLPMQAEAAKRRQPAAGEYYSADDSKASEFYHYDQYGNRTLRQYTDASGQATIYEVNEYDYSHAVPFVLNSYWYGVYLNDGHTTDYNYSLQTTLNADGVREAVENEYGDYFEFDEQGHYTLYQYDNSDLDATMTGNVETETIRLTWEGDVLKCYLYEDEMYSMDNGEVDEDTRYRLINSIENIEYVKQTMPFDAYGHYNYEDVLKMPIDYGQWINATGYTEGVGDVDGEVTFSTTEEDGSTVLRMVVTDEYDEENLVEKSVMTPLNDGNGSYNYVYETSSGTAIYDVTNNAFGDFILSHTQAQTFMGTSHQWVKHEWTYDGDKPISLTEYTALGASPVDADWKKEGTIVFTEWYDDATAVNQVSETSRTVYVTGRFNANGQAVQAYDKGLQLVKYSDGTTAKVLVR